MIETDLPKNKGIYIRHLIFIVAITTILLSGLAFFSNVQVKKNFFIISRRRNKLFTRFRFGV